MAKGVWVYAETKEGQLKKVVLELLSEGKKIASQSGEDLSAVLLGKDVAGLADTIGEYGADKVYLAEDDKLASYTSDAYSKVIADLAKEKEPSVILCGCTVQGRDLSARVAQKLKTGLMNDCTGLETKDNQLVFIRPIYAGKAFTKQSCPEARPVIASIRPNVLSVEQPQSGRKAAVEKVAINLESKDLRQVIKDVIKQVSARPELTEADIIVSGGRGMKDPKNFKLLEDLADVLGAAVGASRAAVDAGWIDLQFQVGQTGKTVSPVLYIACGISGAIQHLAGMSSSKCIVAINKDPEANIFKAADYGIVADLFDAVPILTDELKKMVAS